MRLFPIALAAIAALGVAAPVVSAQTKVFGTGLASQCSKLARAGQFDREALRLCDLALDEGGISRDDAAKTFVNRGVIHLRRQSYKDATADLATAERLMPLLGEIYINRGVVLIKQRMWNEAIAEFDRGIALNPDELEKAYFNRALAREQIDDFRGAYADFRKAQQIAPEWTPVQKELLRYTVKRPAA